MRIAKDEVDVKMEIPGAVIRQRTEFGDATGLGKISGECFTLSAGVDTSPLFEGLEGDLCQCPHWGIVLQGQLTTTDAEIVMFSPQHAHSHVIDHTIKKVNS